MGKDVWYGGGMRERARARARLNHILIGSDQIHRSYFDVQVSLDLTREDDW